MPLHAVYGLSYLTMAARGSPPSAVYEHADGGTYRGQWRGAQKQGLGVYAYPGGGRCDALSVHAAARRLLMLHCTPLEPCSPSPSTALGSR